MERSSSAQADSPAIDYCRVRQEFWDARARNATHHSWGGLYHRHLQRVYRFLVPEGQHVLELGCGNGDLLAAVKPAHGVGVDFSAEMIALAGKRHPHLQWLQMDAQDLSALQGKFDFIILSDLINDLWDVQTVLEQLEPLCTSTTRIILNYYSHLWEWPLRIAQKLHMATPRLEQNWLTNEDVANLAHLTGFDVLRRWTEMIWPLPIPLIEPLCNRVLARLWPFRDLALANFVIARSRQPRPEGHPSVSVIVPARNESGNIPAIFARLPEMGRFTELIFVEGHSRDDTAAVIRREIDRHPQQRCLFLQQTGMGKADAVRLGFAHASGDILMILDADLTVPPEDLPRFYEALVSNRGEFINGVRLVYPMERQAMRSFNLLGNKLFSLAFSWLLGQPIKDTLCGTKVLWRADYERIAANRSYFGDFDPFGDFDLLFGAARLNRRIIDLPIRYRERVYGTTNISRFRHGLLLLRMVLFAARRIKFV